MPKAPTKQRSSRLLYAVLLLIGLCCILYAGIELWDRYAATHGTVSPPNPRQTVTVTSSTPQETPVPTDIPYEVAADQPKQISIPSIDADGFIQRVGEDQHKEIGAPSNVSYAGWFTGSVRPGEPGLSVIDGHVSGRYSPGLFGKLSSLQDGATVTVRFGDDSVRHFVVVEKHQLSKEAAAAYLLKQHSDISQQLNLITCGGTFDRVAGLYNDRIIVVTRRVN